MQKAETAPDTEFNKEVWFIAVTKYLCFYNYKGNIIAYKIVKIFLKGTFPEADTLYKAQGGDL